MNRIDVFVRRQIAARLSWLARLYVKFKVRACRHNGRPFVLILTFGKVASTSVYESLKARLEANLFHIHYLSEDRLAEMKTFLKQSDRGSLSLHILESEALRSVIDAGTPLQIVTLVREPIGRRLSSVFQNADVHGGRIEGDDLSIDEQGVAALVREILARDETLVAEEKWLQSELADEFGLDVFAAPFDPAKGYSIVEGDRHRLLLLRVEDLRQSFRAATEAFFGIPDGIELQSANVADDKYYSDTYRAVKAGFQLDSALVDDYTNTRYFRHFYSDKGAEIRDRWCAG